MRVPYLKKDWLPANAGQEPGYLIVWTPAAGFVFCTSIHTLRTPELAPMNPIQMSQTLLVEVRLSERTITKSALDK